MMKIIKLWIKYISQIIFVKQLILKLIAIYLKKVLILKISYLCLTKIFINCNNIENNLIRHHYISRALLILIKNSDFNKIPKWITFNEYITENKN